MFEELYKIWTQLGVGFLAKSKHPIAIDLEKTLLITSRVGREDSRLIFGMRAWLLKHHDLVNGSRLIRLIKSENETAVLGAIIDSVLVKSSRSTLHYVRKYCKKSKTEEFVFTRIMKSKVQSDLNRKECLPVWKKWNLISREMDDMPGTIMGKSYVFRHNRALALRALFGPIIKADLFAFFLEHKEGNAHHIAKSLGLSYEPVYTELTSFKEIGLIDETRRGLARVFRVKAGVGKKLEGLLDLGIVAS